MGCCSSKINNSISTKIKEGKELSVVRNNENSYEKIKIKRKINIDEIAKETVTIETERTEKKTEESEGNKLILPKHQDSIKRKIATIEEKKFQIFTDETSLIKLSRDFRTSDEDLKTLVDLFNEPSSEPSFNGWNLVLEETEMKIERKILENNPTPITRTIAMINNFTAKEIFEALINIPKRRQWDTAFIDFSVVEENLKDGYEILYMSIKSPIAFISPRDNVQKRKIYKNFPKENSYVVHFKSIQHEKCPEIKNFVRACTYISGYFIENIKSYETEQIRSRIGSITQTELGGSIPQGVVNTFSKTVPKDWVINLKKGLEKLKKGGLL